VIDSLHLLGAAEELQALLVVAQGRQPAQELEGDLLVVVGAVEGAPDLAEVAAADVFGEGVSPVTQGGVRLERPRCGQWVGQVPGHALRDGGDVVRAAAPLPAQLVEHVREHVSLFELTDRGVDELVHRRAVAGQVILDVGVVQGRYEPAEFGLREEALQQCDERLERVGTQSRRQHPIQTQRFERITGGFGDPAVVPEAHASHQDGAGPAATTGATSATTSREHTPNVSRLRAGPGCYCGAMECEHCGAPVRDGGPSAATAAGVGGRSRLRLMSRRRRWSGSIWRRSTRGMRRPIALSPTGPSTSTALKCPPARLPADARADDGRAPTSTLTPRWPPACGPHLAPPPEATRPPLTE
jgi:hypothetical protein